MVQKLGLMVEKHNGLGVVLETDDESGSSNVEYRGIGRFARKADALAAFHYSFLTI